MNTIRIQYNHNIIEINQEPYSEYLDIDVLDMDGELEYMFDMKTDELGDFLEAFQKKEGIL